MLPLLKKITKVKSKTLDIQQKVIIMNYLKAGRIGHPDRTYFWYILSV